MTPVYYGMARERGGQLHLILNQRALCGAEPEEGGVWPVVMRGIITGEYAMESNLGQMCRKCLEALP